jgi:TIGR03009 family protein
MRNCWLTLTLMLWVVNSLSAQNSNAAAAPALDPTRNQLDAILLRWEEAIKKVSTLSVQLTRTTVEKTFSSSEVFEGYAKYMKPNLALMYMQKKNKPAVYEKYICTGAFLYGYAPQEMKIRVMEMPQGKDGQIAPDHFLAIVFNTKAADVKGRYELTLLPAPPNDKWYYYVLIKPKAAEDKKDFARARVVLNNQTFLPRQLWFEQPNGNEVTWDFPRMAVNNTDVKRTDFAMPQLEKGWSFDKITKDVQPRIVRPQR